MQGYSIPAAAAIIGVARSTLYLLMREGRGPAVTKIGSRSIIYERDILTWLDKQPKK